MSSINYDIPSDIWGAILVHFPAEFLIRARAVSKGWRAVIDDPCFVRAHTIKNQQLSSSKIIIENKAYLPFVRSCYSLDLQSLISGSNRRKQKAIAATPLDLDFVREGLLLKVVAECNGLVLTGQNPAYLKMWNPLTNERLDLPPAPDYPISTPPTPDLYPKYESAAAFGLGYDSATDDYKAVAIVKSRDTYVYSLKQDSWTRSIVSYCPPQCDSVVGPGVFVCGALNWLSERDVTYYDDKIVALDLRTEKYSLLQMPPDLKTRWRYSLLLNVVGGCLAVCDSGSYEDSYLDVWVMKVYGEEDSWTKLFSLEAYSQQNICEWTGYISPVAFIMEEKLFVCLKDGTGRFFLFDVETKSFKTVKINGYVKKKGSSSYQKQMFVGNIFRLHANCGGGRVRKIETSSDGAKKKKKRKASSAKVRVVNKRCKTTT